VGIPWRRYLDVFAKMYPDQIKKLVTLDNLRVPFMTTVNSRSLVRSKDPVFKTDPGVLPEEEVREKAGITVVHTGFQHNDMRDTVRSSQGAIQTCWAIPRRRDPLQPVEPKDATCTDRSGPVALYGPVRTDVAPIEISISPDAGRTGASFEH